MQDAGCWMQVGARGRGGARPPKRPSAPTPPPGSMCLPAPLRRLALPSAQSLRQMRGDDHIAEVVYVEPCMFHALFGE